MQFVMLVLWQVDDSIKNKGEYFKTATENMKHQMVFKSTLKQNVGLSTSWNQIVKHTTKSIFPVIALDTVQPCMFQPSIKRQLQPLSGTRNWVRRIVYGNGTFQKRI